MLSAHSNNALASWRCDFAASGMGKDQKQYLTYAISGRRCSYSFSGTKTWFLGRQVYISQQIGTPSLFFSELPFFANQRF